MGLGLRTSLLYPRGELDQTVQYSIKRRGPQPPPQDHPARNTDTRSLQALGPIGRGGGWGGRHSCSRAPSTGTRTKRGNQGRVSHPLPPLPSVPSQACGRNRKDQLTQASSSKSLRAAPLLPQTASSQGHLIFALPPNCQLVVTQTSTTITLAMLPCGHPSFARKTEVPWKPSEPLPCHGWLLRPERSQG